MDSSQFSDVQPRFEAMQPVHSNGATCDTFRVKLFGKLHFLKRLKAGHACDIRYQEAFRKEFETGYRLEHPHLVRYISFSGDGILMEYVDGETLGNRLAANPDYFNSRKHTRKFLRQLLDAVGYLHSHQVLHLDLKPDNIMLTRINDDVKLIDLGCCLTDTYTDTTGRTDRYAAPEQFPSRLRGGAGMECDERTDIYAIGRIMEQLPCHHKYNKVIARCTAPDKADRYQTVADLQDALFTQRRAWLWTLLTICVVVLTVGYYVLTSKEPPTAIMPVPQTESGHKETPETVFVKATAQPVVQKKGKTIPGEEHPTTLAPAPLDPLKNEVSKEEKEYINQPHLRIATQEEFTRYKQQMDEYYSEVNAFLADTTNFQKYPSHIVYMRQYQEIIWRTMERINADEWFRPLFESPMNPVSSYTREYKSEVEHRAFLNGNKLP